MAEYGYGKDEAWLRLRSPVPPTRSTSHDRGRKKTPSLAEPNIV